MSHVCRIDNCSRSFLTPELMADHAAAVHTFGEIRALVQGAIKEKFARDSTMTTPGVYAWVEDLATDWVVFELNSAGQEALFRCDYTVDDQSQVTLGDPSPVVRRMVYDPVSQPTPETEENDDEEDD